MLCTKFAGKSLEKFHANLLHDAKIRSLCYLGNYFAPMLVV
jgi:hypothetical protein